MKPGFSRLLAYGFYWQHPAVGVLSAVVLSGFAIWVISELSSLNDLLPNNNLAAARGILVMGGIALIYIAWRLARYAWARVRYGLAQGAPGWSTALVDVVHYIVLTLLGELLLLAPVLGKEGYPLVYLGYASPGLYFVLGILAGIATLALLWPAWMLSSPPHRIMPYVPTHPHLGKR
ncbi:MAG: hypothetical protein U5P41_11510 [Gammaproteobacteria bacterium]|nr:hypothetical protein [Gammaproteobacteria bacterium]